MAETDDKDKAIELPKDEAQNDIDISSVLSSQADENPIVPEADQEKEGNQETTTKKAKGRSRQSGGKKSRKSKKIEGEKKSKSKRGSKRRATKKEEEALELYELLKECGSPEETQEPWKKNKANVLKTLRAGLSNCGDLPGKLLRNCLHQSTSFIEKAVDSIPFLKIPLLKLSGCLEQIKTPISTGMSMEDFFIAHARRLISGSVTPTLKNALHEILLHEAKTNQKQEIREGFLAAMVCLSLHNADLWEIEENPLWIAILKKSARQFATYWPIESLIAAAMPEQSMEEIEIPRNGFAGNPFFYKYITKEAIQQTERVFLAASEGKYNFLFTRLLSEKIFKREDEWTSGQSPEDKPLKEVIQQAKDIVSWQWEASLYKVIEQQLEVPGPEHQLLKELEKVLDLFGFHENPIILLAGFLYQCRFDM